MKNETIKGYLGTIRGIFLENSPALYLPVCCLKGTLPELWRNSVKVHCPKWHKKASLLAYETNEYEIDML